MVKNAKEDTKLLKEILKSQKVEAKLPECFKDDFNIHHCLVWGQKPIMTDKQRDNLIKDYKFNSA